MHLSEEERRVLNGLGTEPAVTRLARDPACAAHCANELRNGWFTNARDFDRCPKGMGQHPEARPPKPAYSRSGFYQQVRRAIRRNP